jgi:all-trans-8'-apo-beta-carotenal 15,15'-oxygenase
MRIVLVPRCGGPHRIVETDSLVYVHTNNAYEDGEDVVLEVVRHDSFELLGTDLRNFRDTVPTFAAPCRLRITKTGRVLTETLDVTGVEFPTHDERRTGRAHRYSYYDAFDTAAAQTAVVKLDHATGTARQHVFTDLLPGEPVFVPRPGATAEDDGWLLVIAYLPAEHRTALVVLDAADIESRTPSPRRTWTATSSPASTAPSPPASRPFAGERPTTLRGSTPAARHVRRARDAAARASRPVDAAT